jgi:hypothetical protein
MTKVEIIFESFINGQRKQAATQIEGYSDCNYWDEDECTDHDRNGNFIEDYKNYLDAAIISDKNKYEYMTDAAYAMSKIIY